MADQKISEDTLLGLTNRFSVSISGVDLGNWSSCQGLKVTFNPVPIEAGGDYGYVHLVPGQVKYPPVTMARAMSATESKKLKDWLAKQADQLNSIGGNLDYDDSHATITLLDARGIEVIHWDLRGVHPNSWSVSPFDANTSKVAIETLELVHEGFL